MPSAEFFQHLAEVKAAQEYLAHLKEQRAGYVAASDAHVAKLDDRIAFAEKRLNDALAKHVEECRCLT